VASNWPTAPVTRMPAAPVADGAEVKLNPPNWVPVVTAFHVPATGTPAWTRPLPPYPSVLIAEHAVVLPCALFVEVVKN